MTYHSKDSKVPNSIGESTVSSYVSSESDDDAAPLSGTEFANIIAESGRDLAIIFKLCRACQSIVGWFFLDRRTRKRATAGRDRYVSIQVLKEADLVATCLLCGLLGNIMQSLIAPEIGDWDWGYQISATTTAWLFK